MAVPVLKSQQGVMLKLRAAIAEHAWEHGADRSKQGATKALVTVDKHQRGVALKLRTEVTEVDPCHSPPPPEDISPSVALCGN